MEETTFFNQGNIWVTNARFIVYGQTYAMNGVTSVRQLVTRPSRFGPICLIIIGLLCLLGGSGTSVFFCLVFIGIGALWWVTQKPTWTVVLSSSSGEHRALTSPNQAFIQGVVDALNTSIVHRG